jgi:hypothetical protein
MLMHRCTLLGRPFTEQVLNDPALSCGLPNSYLLF